MVCSRRKIRQGFPILAIQYGNPWYERCCDSLTRQAKHAYFVRNDTDNVLAFSEIFELPKNGMVAKELSISEWVDDFDLD